MSSTRGLSIQARQVNEHSSVVEVLEDGEAHAAVWFRDGDSPEKTLEQLSRLTHAAREVAARVS